MLYNYDNPIYSKIPFKADTNQDALLAKPIIKVQKTIEGSVDTIVGKDEKKSNKYRNSIAVGSSVLVLSALVAILNPKFSPKLAKKLNSLSKKAEEKAGENKDATLVNKFYSFGKSVLETGEKSVGFINNFNSAKDAGFKWFCTEKKNFYNVRNKSTRRALKKCDSAVIKALKKPHEAITKFFDDISQNTVLFNYKRASKKMNSLEDAINSYKNKLPEAQKNEVETKLAEIRTAREYFSKENTLERFTQQENSMQKLEHDFWTRYKKYKSGFLNKWLDKKDHFNKNLSFWAEDIMRPTQTNFEQKGAEAVSKLLGNGDTKSGAYNEIVEILSSHLSAEEKSILNKRLQLANKSLKKANHSECVEYFGKKRDLVLGSAPTDVLTAIFGLGMSGIALSMADSKDELISKSLTGVFPIVGGLVASMIFTAMLVSGPVGMLAGAGVGVVLNRIGSFTNKQILGNKVEAEVLNA